MLGSIPAQWAEPIGLIIVVFGSILLLYPLVWRLTIKQLSAALRALDVAKEMPDLAAKLDDLGAKFVNLRSQISQFEEKLPDTSAWLDRFEQLTRLSTDLQKQLDNLQNTPSGDVSVQIIGSVDNEDLRDHISDAWWKIKETIESKINSMDGRKKRKYNGLTRYTYDEVGPLLVRDGILNREQGSALAQADTTYRSLRNRRLPVDVQICEKFDQWLQTVEGYQAA